MEYNACICHKCGKIHGPYSKRKMKYTDGMSCDSCKGPLIPIFIGMDLATGNNVDASSTFVRK